MVTPIQSRKAREALDSRLSGLRSTADFAVPQRGWIRAIRDALGMTAEQLGARMGVTGASVRSLEEKEMTGGVRLASLRRAAAAMDCTLVYAFVPNESLEATVTRRAEQVLVSRQRRIRQTMVLEAQEEGVARGSDGDLLREVIGSGRLWATEMSPALDDDPEGDPAVDGESDAG